MNNKNPTVSIITPNLNGGKYLEETIKSVVHQDYKPIEYIIIDGGSEDDSHSIINKYSKYINHFEIRKDKNMYEALKHGFKLAKGDIFAWINSDDFYYQNCIRNPLNYKFLNIYSV